MASQPTVISSTSSSPAISPSSDADSDARRFVRANTVIAAPPLLPEMRLHLATEVTPLWLATEAELERANVPPPFWAFPWAGGQAVARHVLDAPETVAGSRVMDFASGGGMVGIAAALAGASSVVAVDIDPFAAAAIAINAELNGVTVRDFLGDIVGRPPEETVGPVDVILAGDICYERPMTERIVDWLTGLASRGVVVLIGDPGRAYLPRSGMTALSTHTVPTSTDLEDRETREGVVWRLNGR